MFKHYFEGIQYVDLWPVIALILFFAFFVGIVIRVFLKDKNYIREMKYLPFEDGHLTDGPETNLNN